MIKSEASGTTTTRGTLSRPTTASVMKMIHKLVPSSYQPKSKRKVQAKDIQKLIDKVTRYQKKTVDINKAFVKSLGDWGTDLPTSELRHTMRVFSSLLDSISVSVLEECDRLAELKISLGAISQREERQRFLVSKHDTLQAKLSRTALDNGPQACQTMLCVDEIEENEYNLKLIEQQLARTATQNLHKTCGEFLKWVKTTNTEVTRISEDLAKCINDPKLGNYEKDFKIEFTDYKITQDSGKVQSPRLESPKIPDSPRLPDSAKLSETPQLESPQLESPRFSDSLKLEGYSGLQIKTQYRDHEKIPEKSSLQSAEMSAEMSPVSPVSAVSPELPRNQSHFRSPELKNESHESHFRSPEINSGESHFRSSDSHFKMSETRNEPNPNFNAVNGVSANFNGVNPNFNGVNPNFNGVNPNFNGVNPNFNGVSADYNANYNANFKKSESVGVKETPYQFEKKQGAEYEAMEKNSQLKISHKEDSTTLVFQEPARTRQDTLDSPMVGHVPILDMSREKISEFDIRNYEQNIEGWGNHRF